MASVIQNNLKKYLRYSVLYCFLRTVSNRNVFLKKTFGSLRLKKNISDYIGSETPLHREMNQKIATAIIKDMFHTLRQDGSNLFIFYLTKDASGINTAYYRRISNDLGFFFASFAELSDEYRRNSQKYIFKYDGHFNEKGNVLVAKALYSFLHNNVLKAEK